MTGLGDGTRVSKSDARVHAMGDVDELNCAIGLLLAVRREGDAPPTAALIEIQQDLLDLGGELSIPGHTLLNPARVAALDDLLQSLNATLPRLREFVQPGGSIAAAQAHMCRTICRRAERSVIGLAEVQAISAPARQYLNRLSDLMFVIARVLNRQAGFSESMWNRERLA